MKSEQFNYAVEIASNRNIYLPMASENKDFYGYALPKESEAIAETLWAVILATKGNCVSLKILAE